MKNVELKVRDFHSEDLHFINWVQYVTVTLYGGGPTQEGFGSTYKERTVTLCCLGRPRHVPRTAFPGRVCRGHEWALATKDSRRWSARQEQGYPATTDGREVGRAGPLVSRGDYPRVSVARSIVVPPPRTLALLSTSDCVGVSSFRGTTGV